MQNSVSSFRRRTLLSGTAAAAAAFSLPGGVISATGAAGSQLPAQIPVLNDRLVALWQLLEDTLEAEFGVWDLACAAHQAGDEILAKAHEEEANSHSAVADDIRDRIAAVEADMAAKTPGSIDEVMALTTILARRHGLGTDKHDHDVALAIAAGLERLAPGEMCGSDEPLMDLCRQWHAAQAAKIEAADRFHAIELPRWAQRMFSDEPLRSRIEAVMQETGYASARQEFWDRQSEADDLEFRLCAIRAQGLHGLQGQISVLLGILDEHCVPYCDDNELDREIVRCKAFVNPWPAVAMLRGMLAMGVRPAMPPLFMPMHLVELSDAEFLALMQRR